MADSPLSSSHGSHALGGLLGLGAAACYSAASACLRDVTHCPAMWVSCVKAAPTVLAAGSIVAMQAGKDGARLPPPRLLGLLALSGAFVQIGGNAVNQWSLEIVGLVGAGPLTFAGLLLFGGALGRFWLGERISYRSAAGMLLVLASIPLIRWGAAGPIAEAPSGKSSWLTTLGVLAACFSGVAYATQAAVIRKVARGMVPLPQTLLIFSAVGVAVLGSLSLLQHGVRGLAGTAPGDLATMVLAGIFNAVGFFALSASLQRIPVARVNTLNASQIAMTAAAGMVFFQERCTWPVALGICLTIGGLLLRDGGKKP